MLGTKAPSVSGVAAGAKQVLDAAALTGAVYRQQVAEALYAGLVRYQKSLKSSPRVPLAQ